MTGQDAFRQGFAQFFGGKRGIGRRKPCVRDFAVDELKLPGGVKGKTGAYGTDVNVLAEHDARTAPASRASTAPATRWYTRDLASRLDW